MLVLLVNFEVFSAEFIPKTDQPEKQINLNKIKELVASPPASDVTDSSEAVKYST